MYKNADAVLKKMLAENPPELIYTCSKLFGIIRYYVHSKNKNYDVYNYTENNQEYNNKIIDDFLLETIQKDKTVT